MATALKVFLCMLIFSSASQAAEHVPRKIVPQATKVPEEKALVAKYVLQIFNAASDKNPNCGAAFVKCEGAYFLYTATHCWQTSQTMGALSHERSISFEDGKNRIPINLPKHSVGVRINGDLLRIKIPQTYPLLAQAIQEDRVLKCSDKKTKDHDDKMVLAIGRPGCISHKPYVVQCSSDECTPKSGLNFDGGMAMADTCFTQSLGGMSGGPVVVKDNGELKYLGSISHHSSKTLTDPLKDRNKPVYQRKDKDFVWGELVFMENEGPWERVTLFGNHDPLP